MKKCKTKCKDCCGSKVVKRKLISGRILDQRDKELPMTISSKCPEKWLFVDLETGDIWHIREDATTLKYPFWRIANEREMKDLRSVLVRIGAVPGKSKKSKNDLTSTE